MLLMSLGTQMGPALPASLRLLAGLALPPRQLTLHSQKIMTAALVRVLSLRQAIIGDLCLAALATTSFGSSRRCLRSQPLVRQI